MENKSPTVEELTEEIWQVVSRRHVDRQIAIEAIKHVGRTLRLDEQIDEEFGLGPKGGIS